MISEPRFECVNEIIMKNLFVWFGLFFLILACKNESEPDLTVIGDWELVEIYNPWTGEAGTKYVDRYFQTYKFMSNGTFTKTRKNEGGTITTGSGTYELEEVPLYISSDAKLYINLTFIGGDEVKNNCGEPNSEQLHLRNNGRLNNFSATPCDGPGYTFEKK